MIAPAYITEWSQQCPWISATEFALNLTAKMNHAGFLSDTPPLLRPGIQYDPKEAADWLTQHLIPLISIGQGESARASDFSGTIFPGDSKPVNDLGGAAHSFHQPILSPTFACGT